MKRMKLRIIPQSRAGKIVQLTESLPCMKLTRVYSSTTYDDLSPTRSDLELRARCNALTQRGVTQNRHIFHRSEILFLELSDILSIILSFEGSVQQGKNLPCMQLAQV